MEETKKQEPPKSDLELIVEEMRKLGVKEYHTKDGVKVVLGDAPAAELTEEMIEAQQRARDTREAAWLEYKRNMLTKAAPRIGPPLKKIT